MSYGVKNDLRGGEELNHLAVVKLILVISVQSGGFWFFWPSKRTNTTSKTIFATFDRSKVDVNTFLSLLKLNPINQINTHKNNQHPAYLYHSDFLAQKQKSANNTDYGNKVKSHG